MRRTIYQSFMLRLQCVERTGEPICWHSEVKHIQSGADYRFDNLDSLVAFLRRQIESTMPEHREGDPGHTR